MVLQMHVGLLIVRSTDHYEVYTWRDPPMSHVRKAVVISNIIASTDGDSF